MLQEAFRQFYPSVRSAKVMRAPLTGKSRNFGFCRFGSEQERDRALIEMQGQEIGGRPVRVSLATAKKMQTGAGLPALQQIPTGEIVNHGPKIYNHSPKIPQILTCRDCPLQLMTAL